jgi:FAD/FMN-containing dehydrogenase
MARSQADLLNVTVRLVEADPHSVLAYAPARRLALVMAFSQARTKAGERDMRETTVAFIEQVLDLGGSYYLPYRLHAQPEQIARAYPRWTGFVAEKRRLDPQDRFQNRLWQTYRDL